MKYWPALMLILATAVSDADEGFFFPDMEAVVLHTEEGGFFFGPPQGYRAEELPPNHHFATLFRLINKYGPMTESLGVDEGDADYRLTVLARGESFPLLAGEIWISDGENTVFMEKADYSTMQQVLSSRMAPDEAVPSERVEGYIKHYKEYWTDPFPHEAPSELPSEQPTNENPAFSTSQYSPKEEVSGEVEPPQKIIENLDKKSGQGSRKETVAEAIAPSPAQREPKVSVSNPLPESDSLADPGSPESDQPVEPKQVQGDDALSWGWGISVLAVIAIGAVLWRARVRY